MEEQEAVEMAVRFYQIRIDTRSQNQQFAHMRPNRFEKTWGHTNFKEEIRMNLKGCAYAWLKGGHFYNNYMSRILRNHTN